MPLGELARLAVAGFAGGVLTTSVEGTEGETADGSPVSGARLG